MILMSVKTKPQHAIDVADAEPWGIVNTLETAKHAALMMAAEAGLGNFIAEGRCPRGWIYIFEDDLVIIITHGPGFEILRFREV
jgi:hypothetical protein